MLVLFFVLFYCIPCTFEEIDGVFVFFFLFQPFANRYPPNKVHEAARVHFVFQFTLFGFLDLLAALSFCDISIVAAVESF